MKAVILAGGLGTRMREETEFRPKPMVEIGGKPILWHLMKIFAAQGVTDFVILTGYKGEMIKRFFYDYSMLNRDFTAHLGPTTNLEFHGDHVEDGWRVTILDTGQLTLTGERLLRAKDHLGDGPFFLTYGDGLANVDLKELLKVHQNAEATMTISTTKPASRFGVVSMGEGDLVEKFLEKPVGSELVNIGYMACDSAVFEYLREGEALEEAPLTRLASNGLLAAREHQGFWQPMDTIRELQQLNELWENGSAPWVISRKHA